MEQEATAQAESKPISARSRKRDSIEIAIAFILILAVVWSPRPLQRVLWVAAVAGVAILFSISFDGWQAMGFRRANFRRALWIPGAALVLAAAAVAVAIRLHTLRLPRGGVLGFMETYIAYAIWTGVQQFLLQGFFLLRFLRVIPRPALAAFTAAFLFALAHLPNPILAPLTLLWGFVACMLFVRYRNIYPLMMAHAILGITVALTIPGPTVHNMRVGLGYLTYRPDHLPHRTHWLTKP
jgi:membrane protease YdiL (CAAX protease family)